jgi:hypothetical protein
MNATSDLTTKQAKVQKTRLVSLFGRLRSGPWTPTSGWDDQRFIGNCQLLARAGIASKNLPLACVLVELLAERKPDTVRGTMYAAVSAGWIPDTGPKSYGTVQRLLNVLRKKQVIPHDWIVDNIRSTDKPSSWTGLDDFADTVRDAYRKDFWSSLPSYVCVIVEKDTVAGRISEVTNEYNVALHPLRGFSSTTFAYAIGDEWRRIVKPIHVAYIGDHDPSGRQIEESVQKSLREFSGRNFSWTRLAVEPDQFDRYRIIPLAPKTKDTRYQKFAAAYGDQCAEVEAVPANELRQMVEDFITSHIPEGEWERLQEIEAKERDSWHHMIDRIGGGR